MRGSFNGSRLIPSRFGVLTPNAALRSQIVPGEADPVPNTADGDSDLSSASTRTRMSWAQLLKRVSDYAPDKWKGGQLLRFIDPAHNLSLDFSGNFNGNAFEI